MIKVSIVIPIYNVEKYLEKSLSSICNQTLKELEIICVDDGSTDGGLQICKEYQKQDNRIKIIHKENGGLSSARNKGLKNATGKYIYFFDPDDEVEPSMLANMYQAIENNTCDSVISGYTLFPGGKTIMPNYEVNKKLNPIEMIKSNDIVHSHNDLCFVWRYLFKKQIIDEHRIVFNEQVRVGEDFIFILEFLIKSNAIYVIDKAQYQYTTNNSTSIMRTPYKKYLEESLCRQYKIKKELSIMSGLFDVKQYRKDMANYYITGILSMIIRNIFNSEEDIKDGINRVLNYEMFKESYKEIGLIYECTNLKEYVAYICFKYKITPIVIAILKKKYNTSGGKKCIS